MSQTLFYLIIFFVVADYVFEQTLSILNRKMLSPVIPEKSLKGIYDEEKYTKQQSYTLTNSRFSDYTRLFTFGGLAMPVAWRICLGGRIDLFICANEMVVSLKLFSLYYLLQMKY